MRYRLKWLLLAVTLLGFGLGVVAWPVQRQRADLHFYPAPQEASWNAVRRPAGTILNDPLGPPAP